MALQAAAAALQATVIIVLIVISTNDINNACLLIEGAGVDATSLIGVCFGFQSTSQHLNLLQTDHNIITVSVWGPAINNGCIH